MKTKFLVKILVVIIVITVILAILAFSINHSDNQKQEIIQHITQNVDGKEELSDFKEKYNQIYEKYSTLNSDYVCYIEYENDLIYGEDSDDKYPHVVVKSHIIEDGEGNVNDANNEYLRHNIAHEEVIYGQEFMDGSNVLDENNLPIDQNIIIYGHNVSYDPKLKFTNLHRYSEGINYEDYDTFTLTFKDEQRKYIVTDVFDYLKSSFNGIREESPFATSYSVDELDAYMNKVKNEYKNYLNTGITITTNDKFVTLQTCYHEDKNKLLIVLGKEIERIKLN